MKYGISFRQSISFRWLIPAFCLAVLLLSCRHNRDTTKTNSPYSSDRSVLITFYPFWGGSASCELERKKGNDKLVYTYHIQKTGTDTTYSAFVNVSPQEADSVFMLAEKVNWDPGINYGTADDKSGLRVNALYQKGPTKKYTEWSRLQSASELPQALYKLAGLLNQYAPDDFKLF